MFESTQKIRFYIISKIQSPNVQIVGTLPCNYFLTHVTPSECGLLTKLIGMINQRSFREQILSSKSCQQYYILVTAVTRCMSSLEGAIKKFHNFEAFLFVDQFANLCERLLAKIRERCLVPRFHNMKNHFFFENTIASALKSCIIPSL